MKSTKLKGKMDELMKMNYYDAKGQTKLWE